MGFEPAQETGKDREPGLIEEVTALWQSLPGKWLFGVMMVAWVALFHFLGNSTFGYLDTPSLFEWLRYTYRTQSEDALGPVMPFVVLALLVVKRRELIPLDKGVWWPALLVVVAGLLVHLVGYLIQQARISVIGFFLGLYGLTGVVWGWAWMRGTFFPYLLFAFCFPLGTLADRITFPLRMLVTRISVGVADLLGIEVVRVGTQIMGVDGFNYDVAPACSGIRSLMALLALTTVFSFLTFRTGWRRALMISMALPLAVVGNVARVAGVIIVAQAFGQDAGTRFHDGAGFVTFLVALGCIFLLARFLREPPDRPPAEGETPSGPIPVARTHRLPTSIGWARQGAVLAVTLALIASGMGVLAYASAHQRLGEPGLEIVSGELHDENGELAATNIIRLPERVLFYGSEGMPVTRDELNWLPPDTTYGFRRYTGPDGFWLDLRVVLMGTDRTSIHKPEYCLPGQGFQIIRSEPLTVRMTDPHPYDLPVTRIIARRVVQRPGSPPVEIHAVFVYWFVADGQLSADHLERMMWMARDLVFRGTLQRWAYVSAFAICRPGQEESAYRRVREFLVDAVPRFQRVSGVSLEGVSEAREAVEGVAGREARVR
jgi:exosortase